MDTKKLLVGAAAATALAVGGGAALAAGPDTTAQQDGTKQEEQEPSYTGSIKAPEKQGDNEAEDQENEATENQRETAEGHKLQGLAKVDQTSAERAALEAVQGTVKETDLESENGFVVYGVEVSGNDGKTHDVKVDAGTGEILHQQADGAEGSESEEAPETVETGE